MRLEKCVTTMDLLLRLQNSFRLKRYRNFFAFCQFNYPLNHLMLDNKSAFVNLIRANIVKVPLPEAINRLFESLILEIQNFFELRK